MSEQETADKARSRSGVARPLLCVGAALAIGIAGAALAKLAGMPLPYLLGPLIGCAMAALAGMPVEPVPLGREFGQVVIGLAIGLRFVPTVLVATLNLLPFMALATVLTVLATMAAAFMLQRLGRIDRKTAFFATAAAGLAEMAVVAREKGGDSDIVAVVHLVRVTAIVTTVPFLVTIFGEHGTAAISPVPLHSEVVALVVLLAVSLIAVFWARRFQFPNSSLLIPACIGVLVAGLGFGPLVVPQWLLMVAQIVIGTWLGCRFRRNVLRKLPRVTVSAFATTSFLVIASVLIALLLTAFTGLPFATSLLAVAPAGITEMVITATAMHLDATTVTAFQITRIAVVMTTILFTFRAFETLSQWIEGRRT
jgi:membrane AbrB-like protein